MCGICGIYGAENPEAVRKMCGAMLHRGPDDEGIVAEQGVTLGMRRLKVLDLSTQGHQPMTNEDGNIILVFNGEIYNYKSLNKELVAKGHLLKSRTDTETIIHAYEEWGEACLEKLRGMFAFAIWDKKQEKLFIARDKTGIKPLYYVEENGLFLFSSELKSLTASGLVKKEINADAVFHYVTFGMIPAPTTILKNIKMLLPGHKLLIEKGVKSLEQYWDLTFPVQEEKGTLQEVKTTLSKVMEEAVTLHLQSDVPVGIFLSGGIDSSIIAGLAKKNLNCPLKTFSLGFDTGGDRYNETVMAKKVSEDLESEHHEITITGNDVVSELDRIITSMDQPSHDALNSYFISKAASEHVVVALSGLGADELFGGYSIFKFEEKLASFQWLQNFTPRVLGKAMETVIENDLHRSNSWKWRGLSCILGAYPNPAQRYSLVNLFFQETEKHDLFAEDFKQSIPNSLTQIRETTQNNVGAINNTSYLMMNSYIPDLLLRDTDVMSMSHSLEIRIPFLDQEVIRYAASLPESWKVNNGITKYILKETFHDSLLPEILDKKKMGFAFPLPFWMKEGKFREIIEDCLSKSSIKERGLFNYHAVLQAKNNFFHNNTTQGQVYLRVWLLVVLELWFRKHIDG